MEGEAEAGEGGASRGVRQDEGNFTTKEVTIETVLNTKEDLVYQAGSDILRINDSFNNPSGILF